MKKLLFIILVLISSNSFAVEMHLESELPYKSFAGLWMNTSTGMGITTYNGNQYLAYQSYSSTTNGKLVLCKRPFDGTWACTRYTSIDCANDNHNFAAIGFDESGYLHVWYNMHNDPVRYRRSVNPEDVTSLTAELSMVGTNETAMAYPTPFNDNNGKLFFMFRSGGSGNGDTFGYVYNDTTDTWSHATGTSSGKIIDGKNSTGIRSAYWSKPQVDANNVAHVTFHWRGDTSALSNQDIVYFKWDLTNGTFKKSDNTTQTIPIKDTNDEAIVTSGEGTGIAMGITKNNIALDSNGYPLIAYTKLDGSGDTQLYMSYWNGSTWTETSAISNAVGNGDVWGGAEAAIGSIYTNPPAIAIDANDKIYIFYRDISIADGKILYRSTDKTNWTTDIIYSPNVQIMRDTWDDVFWHEYNIFYLIFNPTIEASTTGQEIRIMKFNPVPDYKMNLKNVQFKGIKF